MHMVMLVLDDPTRLDALLDAWERSGFSGATIVESTGILRQRLATRRVPTRFTFGVPPGRLEEGHYTLFTVVDTEEDVQRCLKAAEAVVGDMDAPHTGIFASWPLTVVRGVPRQAADQE